MDRYFARDGAATQPRRIIFHPETPANVGMLQAAEAAATSAVKVVPLAVHDGAEIERAVTAFATEPDSGLIAAPHAVTFANRGLIVELASRFRLPAVYSFHSFAAAGGLVSYGTNQIEMWRQGASYVDRVLRGTKPADLPAQFPTKYELVVNLKAARALGLNVPQNLLARADEVIE
jgi:putative ABC transport system substrate-binding protein